MLDLTSALAYLHGLGAFHRHTCPRTIVFRGSQIYLSDIRFYSERCSESASKYDAPEIRNKDPVLTRQSNIYSGFFSISWYTATPTSSYPSL